MRGRSAAFGLGWLVVCLAMAGCLESGSVSESMSGFEATYSMEWGDDLHYRLATTQDVMVANGSIVQAWALERWSAGNPANRLVDFLDAGFLRVATMNECVEVVDENCVRTDVTWDQAGLPQSLGLNFPWQAQRASFDYVAGSVPFAVEPLIERREGVTTYEVDRSVLNDNGPFPFAGVWTFQRGEASPVRFTIFDALDRTVRYERRSYTELDGDPPPPHVDWRPLEAPVTAPDSAFAFPGDTAEAVGTGHSYRAILAAFLAAEPDARSALDGGECLVRYDVSPSPNEPDPVSGLLGAAAQVANMRVQIVADSGAGKEWNAMVNESDGEVQVSVTAVDALEDVVGCSAQAMSRAAVMSVAEAWERAEPLLAGHMVHRFSYRVAPENSLRVNPETDGWHSYAFFARPSYVDPQAGGVVGYRPYFVSFNANLGTWDSLRVHPDNLRSLPPFG